MVTTKAMLIITEITEGGKNLKMTFGIETTEITEKLFPLPTKELQINISFLHETDTLST